MLPNSHFLQTSSRVLLSSYSSLPTLILLSAAVSERHLESVDGFLAQTYCKNPYTNLRKILTKAYKHRDSDSLLTNVTVYLLNCKNRFLFIYNCFFYAYKYCLQFCYILHNVALKLMSV